MVLEDGQPRDFSFMRITQYGAAAACEPRGSFSDLLEEFYAAGSAPSACAASRTTRSRQSAPCGTGRPASWANSVRSLARTADREELRRRGDLITANLWRAEKGARTLVCEDYYAEGCPEVEIALDPMKTPQQNAAAAYKEYKKAVAAEQHLTKLIAEGEAMLDYLESVLDLLARASSEKEIAELRGSSSPRGSFARRRAAARSAAPSRWAPCALFRAGATRYWSAARTRRTTS